MAVSSQAACTDWAISTIHRTGESKLGWHPFTEMQNHFTDFTDKRIFFEAG
jgi:hypothetical protein